MKQITGTLNQSNAYIRLKTLSLEEGLNLIRSGLPTVQMDGTTVSTTSLRLQTFLHHGIKCIESDCTREGKFWAVERHTGTNSKIIRFHINLWTYDENGNEALMTCDHIIARSLGGEDALTNTQTMCSMHNSMKSIEEAKIRREIREFEKTARALFKAQETVGGLSL